MVNSEFNPLLKRAWDKDDARLLFDMSQVLIRLMSLHQRIPNEDGHFVPVGGIKFRSPNLRTDSCIQHLHYGWFLLTRPPYKTNPQTWPPDWIISFHPKYYEHATRPKSFRKHLSKKKRAVVHNEFDNTCVYCGKMSEEIDHIVPVSRGGTNKRKNLVASCKKCNRIKSDRLLSELGWSVRYE